MKKLHHPSDASSKKKCLVQPRDLSPDFRSCRPCRRLFRRPCRPKRRPDVLTGRPFRPRRLNSDLTGLSFCPKRRSSVLTGRFFRPIRHSRNLTSQSSVQDELLASLRQKPFQNSWLNMHDGPAYIKSDKTPPQSCGGSTLVYCVRTYKNKEASAPSTQRKVFAALKGVLPSEHKDWLERLVVSTNIPLVFLQTTYESGKHNKGEGQQYGLHYHFCNLNFSYDSQADIQYNAYKNIKKYKKCKRLQEGTKVYKNLQKRTKAYKNVQKLTKTHINLQNLPTAYKSVQKHTTTYNSSTKVNACKAYKT